ncbi:MAG: hypothetical protein JNM90_22915 [Burkholderiales bacterium]|nr:hypothetical protein [Burkholderiales bacterium]
MGAGRVEPHGAHLVGSVALASPPVLFRTAGELLGARLKRIPDGEPGGRNLWISWQYPLLRASPYLQVDENEPANASTGFRRLALAPGVAAADVRFGELGYAREARASYVDFLRARQAGKLPADCRFQVCLPTPFACVFPFVSAGAFAAVEPAYEAAMMAELQSLFAEIPHADLALQWDVCIEMVLWDGGSQFIKSPWGERTREEVLARMTRICAGVPAAVELGVHLCYGDWEARHFVEPRDMGHMVDLASALRHAIAHKLAWIHMPVPVGRDDDGFFKPLSGLSADPATEIYLGLLHLADGVDGARRRIEAAGRYLGSFGVATECGLGRCKTPEMVSDILRLHAQTAAPHGR